MKLWREKAESKEKRGKVRFIVVGGQESSVFTAKFKAEYHRTIFYNRRGEECFFHNFDLLYVVAIHAKSLITSYLPTRCRKIWKKEREGSGKVTGCNLLQRESAHHSVNIEFC